MTLLWSAVGGRIRFNNERNVPLPLQIAEEKVNLRLVLESMKVVEDSMIEKVDLQNPKNISALKAFVRMDNARNYFIRLGLESPKLPFAEVYIEKTGSTILGALFLRASGNMQFYGPGKYDAEGFMQILGTLDFRTLISPLSYCEPLSGAFRSSSLGAHISKRSRNHVLSDYLTLRPLPDGIEINPLGVEDLPEVVRLYEEVFNSFSPGDLMEKKLLSGRGRGYILREGGTLISVAQSEFEEIDSAVIVGVATSREKQGKGFGTACLSRLVNELGNEGKDLYLQYDNEKAGEIYKRLGFDEVDRVKHYEK